MCLKKVRRTKKMLQMLIKNDNKRLTKECSLFQKNYCQRPLSSQYAMIQEFFAHDSRLCQ